MLTADLTRFVKERRPKSRVTAPEPDALMTVTRDEGYTDAEIAQIQSLLHREAKRPRRPLMESADNPHSLRIERLDVKRLLHEDKGTEHLESEVMAYMNKADNMADAVRCFAEVLESTDSMFCHTERNELSRRAEIDMFQLNEIKQWLSVIIEDLGEVITTRKANEIKLRHFRGSSELMEARTKQLCILHTAFLTKRDTLCVFE